MPLIQSKQIEKVIAAPVFVVNVPTNGGTFTLLDSDIPGEESSHLADALQTAGNNGTPVTDTHSPDPFTEGVINAGAYAHVEVYDNATGKKLSSGSGEEVYGRLVGTQGGYAVDYYTNEAGTETAYTLPTGQGAVDMAVNYRFTFKDLPADSTISVHARYASNDPAGMVRKRESEVLTIAVQNTLPDLSTTPVNTNDIKLIINSRVHQILAGAFSISGTSLTWNPAVAGYDLLTTDDVIAEYSIFA